MIYSISFVLFISTTYSINQAINLILCLYLVQRG